MEYGNSDYKNLKLAFFPSRLFGLISLISGFFFLSGGLVFPLIFSFVATKLFFCTFLGMVFLGGVFFYEKSFSLIYLDASPHDVKLVYSGYSTICAGRELVERTFASSEVNFLAVDTSSDGPSFEVRIAFPLQDGGVSSLTLWDETPASMNEAEFQAQQWNQCLIRSHFVSGGPRVRTNGF